MTRNSDRGKNKKETDGDDENDEELSRMIDENQAMKNFRESFTQKLFTKIKGHECFEELSALLSAFCKRNLLEV